MILALLIIGSYLIGSFPSGYVVAKLFAGVDIRLIGTTQIGAANVTRQLGKTFGLLSLSLDLLKGLIPMTIVFYVFQQPMWVTAICGIVTVFGHDFSIFMGFKGGEGLATSLAVLFFISPSRFFLFAPFAILTVYLTGYVTVGGVVQFWGYGVVCWVTGEPMAAVYSTISLVTLALIKQMPWVLKNPPSQFMNPSYIAPQTDPVAAIENLNKSKD